MTRMETDATGGIFVGVPLRLPRRDARQVGWRRVFVVNCTARKSTAPGLIPARERYIGPTFSLLNCAHRPNLETRARPLILVASAKFGLVEIDEKIPFYDENPQSWAVAAADMFKPSAYTVGRKRVGELRGLVDAKIRAMVRAEGDDPDEYKVPASWASVDMFLPHDYRDFCEPARFAAGDVADVVYARRTSRFNSRPWQMVETYPNFHNYRGWGCDAHVMIGRPGEKLRMLKHLLAFGNPSGAEANGRWIGYNKWEFALPPDQHDGAHLDNAAPMPGKTGILSPSESEWWRRTPLYD